jgi:single-strand DNA-binding protein
MNSFTLTAVGHLARNPELVARGSMAYTRFCLVGTDYAGKDEEGAAREVVTSLWFVAFGALGEAVARHSRKGDQLFVEARVRANNWTDKQGDKQYDHAFVVQGFRFGAPGRLKREERDARREDGQGLHRSEERSNGRDRSANGGSHAGYGTQPVSATHAGHGRHGTNGPASVRSAISVRVPVRGDDGSRTERPADAGSVPDGDEADGADESANTRGSIEVDESGANGDVGRANKPGGTDESVVAGESGDTGESVDADEPGGARGSTVADESGEAGGSSVADESDGTRESTGANVSAATGAHEPDVARAPAGATDADGAASFSDSDESVGGEESSAAPELSGAAKSNCTDESADSKGAKSSAKGAAARVTGPRAATGRPREKSGGGRASRRASTSAA